MAYGNSTKRDEKTKQETINRLLYYLCTGKCEKDAAKLVKISLETAKKWLNERLEIKEALQAWQEGKGNNPFHLENNLEGFLIFARKDKPMFSVQLAFTVIKYKESLKPVYEAAITQVQTDRIRGIFAKAGMHRKTFVRSIIADVTGYRKDITELSFAEAERVTAYIKKRLQSLL